MKSKNYYSAFCLGKSIQFLLITLLLFCLISCQKTSNKDSGITKEFPDISTIYLTTVSGNCKIVRSNNSLVKVSLSHHYEPSNSFEPIFEQNKNVLKLEEKMISSNSGSSEWVLSIPDNINIVFSSSSGKIEINNLSLCIKAETSSGDIIAKDVKLIDNSEFDSSSGDVDITLAESPKYNISASSSSGSATINYNNNPIAGKFIMGARVENGDIRSPYKFDTKKEEYKGEQEYIIKSFTIGSEFPIIKIHTASGEACLKK